MIDKTRKIRNTGLILSLIFLTILAGSAFFVNRNIRLDALYMDDLYMWSFYGEQNIWEFSFPFRTASRFRPVYWFLTYLQMAIVGSHVRGYLTFNIITNILLAFTIYGMCTHISGSRIAAFLASLCYLASRFSYYQIGQALGFMETLACFFALWVLFFLYRFTLTEGGGSGCTAADPDNAANPASKGSWPRALSAKSSFRLAVAAYLLVSFTHERYITLVGLFYAALFIRLLRARRGCRKLWFRDNLVCWITPAAAAAAVMLIRFIFIGRSMPGGTGGTDVAETFSVGQTLRFCVSQVLYLLGVNDGPEYLCAIPWEKTPVSIKNLIKLSAVCYGLVGLGFIASMIADLRHRAGSGTGASAKCSAAINGVPAAALSAGDSCECGDLRSAAAGGGAAKEYPAYGICPGQRLFCRKLAVSLLFACFAGICILCSSITVRVEMRWVYVSFAAMQIFACYMLRGISDSFRISDCGKSPDSAEPHSEAPDTRTPGAGSPDARVPDAESLEAVTAAAGSPAAESPDAGSPDAGRSCPLRHVNPAAAAALIIYGIYVLLSVWTNVFCRGYINNIYFMEGQNRANNIACETVYKFGADEVLGKTVFLIDTSYEISDFYCEYFFKPFDPEKTGQGSRLVRVKTLDDSFRYLKEHPSQTPPRPPKSNPDGNISEKAVYLTEDPATGKYIPMNVVN